MTVSAAQPAISVRDLSVSFLRWGQHVNALDHISVNVGRGEWALLVGHNGAGKSTLLKAIVGQLQPDSGDVALFGRPVRGLTARKLAASAFIIHQDPLLGTAPLLTVLENLLVADPRPHADKRSLIREYSLLLEPIGLLGRLNQPAKALSGGERQLLALAIARLRKPLLLLLDEPLAALDPEKTSLCVAEIATIHREGTTILQVAHDIRTINVLADRILTMTHGRLSDDAVTEEVTTKGYAIS